MMLSRRAPSASFARRIFSTLIKSQSKKYQQPVTITNCDGVCSRRLAAGSISCNNSLSIATHHSSILRHSSSISTSSSNNEDNYISSHGNRGEECYQLAMDALQNATKAKQLHEEQLLKEQYDAMEKQRQRTKQREQQRQQKNDPRLQRLNNISNGDDNKDRAAGVAVVRTIVKQSNAAVQVEQWNNTSTSQQQQQKQSNTKKQTTEKKDEEYWQRIAQQCLEEAAFRYGHPSALVRMGNEALSRLKDGSATNSEPLFDYEKYKEWMNESPIDICKLTSAAMNHNDNGDGSSNSNKILAQYLYSEAGKHGSAEGWYNLGHTLWEDTDITTTTTTSDISSTTKYKAMEAFHKAMELGDVDAIYFVAAQYLSYEVEGHDDVNSSSNLLLKNVYEQYGPEFVSSLQSMIIEREWDDFMEKSTQPESSNHINTLDPAATAVQTTEVEAEIMPSFESSNHLHRHGYALLNIAAQHNHGPALHHLALLCNEHGNTKSFREILTKAASTGNTDSLFLQGHCYYFGSDGHEQSYSSAIENFLEAANHGHIDAMISAGSMLHQGYPSDDDGQTMMIQDQQQAFDLYQQAGELGSTEGWRNVVSCYATGRGVPKCLDTATYIANTMLKSKE